MSETPRARIARLHGEAARHVILAAIGFHRENVAAAFAGALEKAVVDSMPDRMLDELVALDDAAVIARVRLAIEPDVRRRLAKSGRLPS